MPCPYSETSLPSLHILLKLYADKRKAPVLKDYYIGEENRKSVRIMSGDYAFK
jgi:hypothetical protein